MKRKAKNAPRTALLPLLSSLRSSPTIPKPVWVRCTTNAKLTVQGTATRAHDFQMAPHSGYPTRLGAQRLPPRLEATAPPEMATPWENQRRVVRRDTSLYRSCRRGRTLAQPALPHAGHELFPHVTASAVSRERPLGPAPLGTALRPRRRDPSCAAPVPATAVPPAAATPRFRSGLPGGCAGLGVAASAWRDCPRLT